VSRSERSVAVPAGRPYALPAHAGGMTETIAGIAVPDTKLVQAATDLVREAADQVLYHHSRRVYLFGRLKARHRGLDVDPELAYVGAMFHDLGLTTRYGRTDQRFEIDGADLARDFLLDHGRAPAEARAVWLAIALHTTPGIVEHLEPEVAVVTLGVETDVLGFDLDEITPAERAAVVEAHERPNFKENILERFADGMKDRPDTTFGTMNDDVLAHLVPGFVRADFVEVIRGNVWPE
jgi:HD superfamily phosphodiesterase